MCRRGCAQGGRALDRYTGGRRPAETHARSGHKVFPAHRHGCPAGRQPTGRRNSTHRRSRRRDCSHSFERRDLNDPRSGCTKGGTGIIDPGRGHDTVFSDISVRRSEHPWRETCSRTGGPSRYSIRSEKQLVLRGGREGSAIRCLTSPARSGNRIQCIYATIF